MPYRYLAAMLFFIIAVSCNADHNKTGTSKRDMAFIIDSLTREYDVKENPFSSAAKISFVDSMLLTAAASTHKEEMQYFKANVLLESGNEEQSFVMLDQLLGKLHTDNQQMYRDVVKNYSIAALRLGEKQNCVLGHSTESCIMPVSANGVHHNQYGSSSAIKGYTELLRVNPNDLESRWLLNIAYMTLGDYPAKVPAQWLIPGLDKDVSGYAVKPFRDIAPQLRLDTKNTAGGMIVEDFNNDGFMDVVNSDWNPKSPMHYFKNNGDGSFSDLSVSSGLSKTKGGLNIVQADYNNDGFIDILVLRGGWLPGKFGRTPNSLLRNNGDNTFTDVTLESGLFSLHPTQTAVWRDFNNDGWLDLFIGNETKQPDDPHPCELFISDKHGRFTDVAAQAGCNITGFVKGVASADYNNDGLPDIFISTYDGKKTLLKNATTAGGIPHFEDVTHAAGLDKEFVKTFPTWFWDYDNDGWPDIFVCGYQVANSVAYTMAADALKLPHSEAGRMYLYHNNHDGTFTDVSVKAGLDMPVFAMGSNFGDIDNDGWLDMYLGTGDPLYSSVTPNKLFKNIGGKKFADVTVSSRTGNLQKGHGVAFSDIDNDGDQDIFLVAGGAYNGDVYFNSLYLNPAQNNNQQNNNHWIYIDFAGVKSNHSAIGSRVKISFKEKGVSRTIYRDVNSGGSFGSSPLRREIGIGQADKIDELTITWAGTNTVQTFTNISANQCIKITEGKNAIEKVALKPLNFDSIPNAVLPCAPVSAKK